MDSTGCLWFSACPWWWRWSSPCGEEEGKITNGTSRDTHTLRVARCQELNCVCRRQVFSSDIPLPHQYYPINMDLRASPSGVRIHWLSGITHTRSSAVQWNITGPHQPPATIVLCLLKIVTLCLFSLQCERSKSQNWTSLLSEWGNKSRREILQVRLWRLSFEMYIELYEGIFN